MAEVSERSETIGESVSPLPSVNEKMEDDDKIKTPPFERTSRSRVASPTVKSAPRSRSNSGTPSESSSANTPGSGKKALAPLTTPSPNSDLGSNRKFPIRPGITWKIGQKVEAMDYLKKWYLAKLIEIDEDECEVLIHFDGWNSRFDEWVEMGSERLRPVTRHSERKELVKPKSFKAPHKIGEKVLAKWTDCRMYPAKVTDILKTGAYEVIFYDGFKRTVQPMNVRNLPEEMKEQEFSFAPSKAKDLKEELEKLGKRKRSQEFSPIPDGIAEKKTRRESGDKHRHISGEKHRHISGEKASKDAKPEPQSPQPATLQKTEKIEETPRKKKPTKKVILGSPKHKKKTEKAVLEFKKKKEASAGAVDLVKKKHDAATAQLIKKKKKLLIGGVFQAKRKHLDRTSVKRNEKSPERASLRKRNRSSEQLLVNKGNIGPVPQLTPPETQLLLAALHEPYMPCVALRGQGELQLSEDGRLYTMGPEGKVWAPKEFKVEEDHNPYKCPYDSCDKGFRKESLLKYHVKYYHLADGSPVPVPLPRKRKHTISMCSTDSDVSVCSKSGGSGSIRPLLKKNRVISAPSALETNYTDPVISDQGEDTQDIQSDAEQRSVSTSLHGDGIEDDSDNEDEVVNCICGFNEETGLMIQCDVCLCWQHAVCFELTHDTLPKKYICYVCLNPPGVRESAKYIYEQDWFKLGFLERFNFLPVENDERTCEHILASHSLMADTINVLDILRGLQRKMHLLKNLEEEELKIWKTNWDRHDVLDMEDHKQLASETFSESIQDTVIVDSDSKQNNSITWSDQHLSTSNTDQTASENLERQDSMEHIDVCGESSDETEKSEMCVHGKDMVSNTTDETPQNNTVPNGNIPQQEIQSGTTDSSVLPAASSDNPQSLQTPSGESGYQLSPLPTRVKLTGSSVWTPVVKNLTDLDALDDIPEEENNNNLEMGEKHLCNHINGLQDELEKRLDLMDQQVTVLENEFAKPVGHDPLSDLPVVKKTLRSLLADLTKVRRMAIYHC